ncbi:MAG: tetratricopeptide repeat protein [Candidatus Saccharibacteria bacterium]
MANWQAAILIVLVGFAVFFTGLSNPFQGDDGSQIVNNVPVHSISNVPLLFKGGTFYDGQGQTKLKGSYYRPLMMTVFSVIYTLFGAKPVYFHIFQLLLGVGSACILYLFFRYSFKPALALFLALIFLVHPLNSQVMYAIPTMQDALFFFFGILGLWLLVRFNSMISLWLVALSLLLSLLSKETGVIFVILGLIYLFWWDRKRLYPFVFIMMLPVSLWLLLKSNAVGISAKNTYNAPIDFLSLSQRLMNAPLILALYVVKFVFPVQLASIYYWVYPSFSIKHFLLPLILDLGVGAIIVYAAVQLRKRATKAQFITFLFFGIWAAIGLAAHLQIIALDMTASESWFYPSMAGVLGMLGIVVVAFKPRISPNACLIASVIIIGLLGLRTGIRGLDWGNDYKMARHDIAASPQDYAAYNTLAAESIKLGNYQEARAYAEKSISYYPGFTNYNNLGVALTAAGDFDGAVDAYNHSLQHGDTNLVYDSLAELTFVHGDPATNRKFLEMAITKYPHDGTLWLYLSILEDRNNNNSGAKAAIVEATKYSQIPPAVYDAIMNNKPFAVSALDGKLVQVP